MNARAIALALLTILFGVASAAPPVRDGDHRTAKCIHSWRALQRRNIVMQERDYSCGAAALATLVKYYVGDDVDETFFLKELDHILTAEEVVDRVKNGLALSDLRKVAVRTGYQAVVAKLSFEKLIEAKAPLLVGIEVDGYKHFVVYRGFDGYWVYLADPIRGNLRIKGHEFQSQWQKNLALAVTKAGLKPDRITPLSISGGEIFVGQTNRQLILTQPTRGSIHDPAPSRH